MMNKHVKDNASLLYVILNLLALGLFVVFVPYKVKGIKFDSMLNLWALPFFLIASALILLSINKKVFKWLLFPLLLCTLFAYDMSAPEAWIDAKGDWITAERFMPENVKHSLKNYSASSAANILGDPQALKRAEQYAEFLPFYPVLERLKYVGEGAIKIDNDRCSHHPPLYFIILGSWLSLDNSVWGMKIFAKFMLLIYLILIQRIFMMMLKKSEEKSWMSLTVILSPAILCASQAPKNDLLLGIFTAGLVIALLSRGAKRDIGSHLLIGSLAALCVFTKFTALLLVLPIVALYTYWHGRRVLQYLALVALPIVVLGIVSYLLFGYDIVLNIIIGRIVQDRWIAANTGALSFIWQRVIFGQYRVGIPLVIMLLYSLFYVFMGRRRNSDVWRIFSQTALHKSLNEVGMSTASIPKKLMQKKMGISPIVLSICVTFYFSIFLLLWGSSVDRHQIGFLPFAIPILTLGFLRFQHLKGFILSLMISYNLLFIVYSIFENSIEFEHLIF